MKLQLVDLVALQEVDSRLDELGSAEAVQPRKSRAAPSEETQRLLAQRKAIAKSLRPELLKYYERVRKRHAQAVVRTSRGTCMGCFTLRPTAMAYGGEGFETCERCSRILIRSEADDAAATAERVESRAGKSSGVHR